MYNYDQKAYLRETFEEQKAREKQEYDLMLMGFNLKSYKDAHLSNYEKMLLFKRQNHG